MADRTCDARIGFENVTDVLMAQADGVITKGEARQLLGFSNEHALSADCWCDPEVTIYVDEDDE